MLFKKEIINLLDVGFIYPIVDNNWACPISCVPQKGCTTLVPYERNELVSMRLVTRWRVCVDYWKLSDWTENDYFPMPSMDKMLD